ncbi:MAG: hypothetical protein JOZ41_19530, partial [Chloroflexi bacterium]|nr:hypothetical protein [Chloroflexota bacterium]
MLLDKTLRSPVVEGAQATFFYEDPMAQEVRFVGDSTAGATIPMERHGDLWTLTRTYPLDARDEYMFVVDGAWKLDPLNSQRGPGAFGPRSACAMPDYRWPRPIQLPCDGKMRRQRLGGRLVDLYVPAQVEGAALLVVQDGSDYIWFTGLPGLLDAMIREGEIVPTLAVFVSPQDRDAEYR